MARITLDFTPAIQQSAGIGRLTREVVRALLELDTPYRFRLFSMGNPRRARSFLSETGRRASVASTPLSDRWMYRIWHRARIPVPVEVFAGRCDLYHATDFVLPPVLPGTRTVLTVHDLTFERDPDSAQPRLLDFLKRVVPRSARRATHVIVDSHATARDLTQLYGIPPDRITTIYAGVDARFAPASGEGLRNANPAREEEALRRKYAIGEAPFILTVGTMQRRKNHRTLVEAFAQLLKLQSPFSRVKLVIAGGKGWLYDDVVAEVTRLGISERVKFIGFVDELDLPALYRAAAVFAFPSLYEGFGIPPLEAMASGVPVVTSNASSLPEVVGNAGLMIEPLDVGALAVALNTALSDVGWRQLAIARGLARAGEFTWRKAAEELLGVYESVLGKASRR